MNLTISKKLLLAVGAIFVLFTIGLTGVIGRTSLNNLRQVKQAELNRMSLILSNRLVEMEQNAATTVQSFEQDDRLLAQIKLLTHYGPYYADPGSYFAADFMTPSQPIEAADQIYSFQAQLNLIQILQSTQRLNNFSSISFYMLPAFDLVPTAKPILAFHLDREEILVSQFSQKGLSEPSLYHVPANQFRPPAADYFDVSSAYSAPPEQFYQENHFEAIDANIAKTNYFEQDWQTNAAPQSQVIIKNGLPIIQTWYPVKGALAHPETWEEETIPLGIAVVEQTLDATAMMTLKNQFGLDVAVARDGQVMMTSFGLPQEAMTLQPNENIKLNQTDFYYAQHSVNFPASPSPHLEAVILSPIAELSQLNQGLLWQLGLATGLVALLTSGVLYVSLLYLVKWPLSSLARGVQMITDGDLAHQVEVRADDELGKLATAFNSMTSQLRQTLQGLEERTEALSQANEEIQRYSAEVEAKNSALEHMDKLKDEFLANTSHELRTPLNGIIGIAESMIDGATGSLTTVQIKNLSIVASSGQRLANLINDILDFSKLKHHNLSLQIKPLQLNPLVEVVLALSQPLIGSKPLELHNVIDPNLSAVYGDENRLQQILHNLVGNAIKFTETGQVEVSAASFKNKDSDYLAVTISDTGMGIAPDKTAQIFQAFEQGDGSIERLYGGTGLGLAVTKQLVELHGGEIWVESTLGQGSKFTFTLPVSTERVEINPVMNHKHDRLVASWDNEAEVIDVPIVLNTGSNDYRILVVDDEPVNRQVLLNQLSTQHYLVDTAPDGVEALRLVASQTPHLVILDVMMPRMSGYEVCREIRRNYSATELPIIMLTAKNQISDLVTSFDCGANDYLTKPFSRIELLVRIRTHLQLANLQVLNANKDRFFSIIAHDLKGPFMPLLGTSELLSEMADFLKPNEIREMGESMYRSAKNVFTLLENLLQWSRIQMGRLKYQPTSMDLNEIVERNMGLLGDNAAKKNIKLINRVQQPLFVFADENMVDTILRNLMSNAIKFTQPNGQVTVAYHLINPIETIGGLSMPTLTRYVEIGVSDTGMGIAPEDMSKLFNMETHHSTLGTAKEKGTGLGLIMCYEMVRKHGGRIWVESELGKGSTFKFTIALADDSLALNPPPESAPVTVEPPDFQHVVEIVPAPPRLVPPPPYYFKRLLELVQIGDMMSVQFEARKLVDLGEIYAPFVDKVTQLARQFEEEELLHFLEEYQED